MADSTLSCFTSLLENVPGWVAELEDILQTAAVKQEGTSFTNRPPTPPRAEPQIWSLRSKRPREGEEQVKPHTRPNSMRPDLPHVTNSDALCPSQKKRKTSSILSDQGSGPAAIRAKTALAVYYDGNTQKRFEKLVRAIGSQRNAVRKGKMSARVDRLSRTGSSSSDGSFGGGEELGIHRLKYRSSRPSPPSSFSLNDSSEVFDNVDAKLEKAQSFCERAAYQVLKDGDCTLEVSRAKEHFDEALQVTRAKLPELKKQSDKAVERQRRSDARRQAEEELDAKRAATALALKVRLQAAATMQSVVPSESSSLEVDPLEADETDEDEEDGEFNFVSLQFGKLSQMRPVQLATAL